MWPFQPKRKMNPNSIENLHRINQERREAKRDAVANSQGSYVESRSPTMNVAPVRSSAPVAGSAQEFFANMMQYEQWRTQVYETEQRRRDTIASQIREQLESQTPAEDAQDPVVSKAMEFILEKALSGRNAGPTANNQPQGQQLPSQLENVQPSPIGARLSQEQADLVADKIEDAYPMLCKQVRAGTLNKAQAMQMLTSRGLIVEDAEMVYKSIIDVEDEPDGSAQ